MWPYGDTVFHLPHNEVNPSRSDALHGFLFNRSLQVESQLTSDTNASVTLAAQFYVGEHAGWPFNATIRIRYELSAHSLSVTTMMTSDMQDGRPLPFFHGCHPYFVVSDVSKATLQLDPCSKWSQVDMPAGAPRNGSLIPTGTFTPFDSFDGKHPIGGTEEQPTYLDNEYKALAGELSCPSLAFRIADRGGDGAVMRLQGDHHYRWFHVFTGARLLWGEPAVAMEPMSAMADAYNNHDGLSVLIPGQTFEGTFSIGLWPEDQKL